MNFLVLLIIFSSRALGDSSILAQYGLKGNFDYFDKTTKNFTRKGNVISFQTISLLNSKTQTRMEIEVVSPLEKSTAETQLQSRYAVIYNLYRDQPTPYHGQVTSNSTCLPSDLPQNKMVKIAGSLVRVLFLSASDRDGYGECAKEKIKKVATMAAFYYPKSKSLFHFKTFSPKSSDDRDVILRVYESLESI